MKDDIFVLLVDEPIDLNELLGKLDDPDVGSHGWFLGVTRRTTVVESESKTTRTLAYEAHQPMAEKELRALATKAREDFGLSKVVIVHRLGEVPIGQASVVVGCSSPHRVDTFDAQRWIMDTLKKEVPIWKREHYADGTTEWVHPTDNDGDDAHE